jgi:hypothetical protein
MEEMGLQSIPELGIIKKQSMVAPRFGGHCCFPGTCKKTENGLAVLPRKAFVFTARSLFQMHFRQNVRKTAGKRHLFGSIIS